MKNTQTTRGRLALCLSFLALASAEAHAQAPKSRPQVKPPLMKMPQNSVRRQVAPNLLRGFRIDKILRGDPSRREIALTIDDSPHLAYTPRLHQQRRPYSAL